MAFDLMTNLLHVHVVDTGTGKRRVDLPNLFADFRMPQCNEILSNQGSGLGLMICKNLVEVNGGSIRVRSKGTNQGCVFDFTMKMSVTNQLSRNVSEPSSFNRDSE